MITPAQIHLLHHTLGVRPDCRTPYRNHYLAGHGHHAMPDLEALEAAGLMARGRTPAFCDPEDVVFLCTDAGKAYATEHLPPEPKRTRYDEYLRDECCESFAQFLGINKPQFEYGRPDPRGVMRVRMVRYRWMSRYNLETEITGDWCATKKDAKASYKAALRAASQEKRS